MGWSARAISASEPLFASRPVRTLVNLGFHLDARLRAAELSRLEPASVQRRVLRTLIRRARRTRFGTDHGFDAIASVSDFQKRVPIRTYETFWAEYLCSHYPVLDNLTWPGRMPFLALTSGTTQGATKYIPVSAEMMASNRKAARTMLACYLSEQPDSRLFQGQVFFLGGCTQLEEPVPGVRQGDLSAIAAVELSPFLRPYTFPSLELALEHDWDKKLARLAAEGCSQPITMISGIPSWLLMLFERLLQISGKSTIAEVWPSLEVVVHGGVKFDPYRECFRSLLGSPAITLLETYPCSEGFIGVGDSNSGLLRLLFDHGLFYEFIPVAELDDPAPQRHWLGSVRTGVNYAIVMSTCAGMWAHLIGDTIRFESLEPPLFTFTGRTKYSLSAFGEHLINEEVEGAIAAASGATGASVRDWHVGPVFRGVRGHHLFVLEFMHQPDSVERFRATLDVDLARRNADYLAHRSAAAGLPIPAMIVAQPGSFEAWMRRRGKLGGQNKVPRMDNSGALTRGLVDYLRETEQIRTELNPISSCLHHQG
jgi:GH3 auxin-responsive promoter